MTGTTLPPDEMARIHAASFVTPRPWSEAEIRDLLGDSACFVIVRPAGFLLGRVVLDEAEILTIAVDPDARRTGTGRALMEEFERISREKGAISAFLEVASDNIPARALYSACGFSLLGRRSRYYRAPDGSLKDAEIMGKQLG